MASDFLKMTVSEILNIYRQKYYEETGQTLRIGSDDMTTASIHAYVYGVLSNAINYAFQNSVLSGASGEWLDAIGETWNVARPSATKASAMFNIKSQFPLTLQTGALRISDNAGHVFINSAEFVVNPGDVGAFVSCEAENAGSDYNNIAIGEVNVLVAPEGIGIYSAENTTLTGGGADEADDTAKGDEIYREYIKIQRKTPLVGASTASYLAKVWNVEGNRIFDACVLEAGDVDYTPGKVKIRLISRNSEYSSDVVERVKMACSASDFRAIGDLVEVSEASQIIYNPWSSGFRIIYPMKFKTIAESHLNRVVDEYRAYLMQGFNRPFSEAELIKRLTTIDENGVYALEANIARNDPNPLRYDAEKGKIINITSLTQFYYTITYM
jgi:uncharacterized phage protein gp47/JayE